MPESPHDVLLRQEIIESQKTQADFPHLVVVADAGRGLSSVADVIHENSNPKGGDTSAPATPGR